MAEYVAVIDEEFNYPMPTIESLYGLKKERNQYTQAEMDRYVELIVAAVSSTDKGLHRLCHAMKQVDSKFPTAVTLLYWIGQTKERSEQYAHAKMVQMDLMAEDTIHIADTEPDPNKARVRIDARKWVASKLAPKKYGERIEVNHGGNLNLTSMTDAELMRIAQEQAHPLMIEAEIVPDK